MENLVQKFYTAFQLLEAEKMVACYHPEIVFEDPAFGKLHGEKAKNMWRMLCASQKGKDFSITFSDIQMNENTGTAKWEARYTFSKTNKKVQNKVTAHFTFKDGLILQHTDSFSLYHWAKQAMGFKGLLLGGTPLFKKQLQKNTHYLLNKYEAKAD